MTGFSATKSVMKTKKRGWSLPCRIILQKQKVYLINENGNEVVNVVPDICREEMLFTC